jgi:hypothetical protein
MADKFVLLVEGKDDEHVLYRLRDHHQLPTTFVIKDKKGLDNLLETLDTELDAGGLERLGVIVDADTAPNTRWQSLRNIFALSDCPLPDQADPLGTIVELSGRTLTRVGVWVMPDNAAEGMLEDFVRSLVPPGDILLKFAEECVDEVMARDRRFPEGHRSKALIHTWLSWQEQPGTPLGLAIKNSRMNPKAASVLPLKDWLRRLFDLDYVS